MAFPLAIEGKRELGLASVVLIPAMVVCAIGGQAGHWWAWILAALAMIVWLAILMFFRDPPRRIPTEQDLLVSPADGKVTAIHAIPQDDKSAGQATGISIFLSVLNVHINRSPCDGTVREVTYKPGQFLDARDPQSEQLNESNRIVIDADDPAVGPVIVRQVAGLIARRIVCNVSPGDHVTRGQKIGMIKFGSRTDLIFADQSSYQPIVKEGDRVHAGTTVLARKNAAGVADNNADPSQES